MSETRELRATAQQASATVSRDELAMAEQRGEERIRQRIRAIPASKRYLHDLDGAMVEVVDAGALEEAIRPAAL